MKVYNGNEPLRIKDKVLNKTILDFWRWNSSDLFNNTLRGAFAEFLVASALDLDFSESHIDWDAYDLLWNDIRIEVKCSAYVHSWSKSPSKLIQYSISQAYEWLPEVSRYSDDYARHSDVYVFCLCKSLDKNSDEPLDLDNWTFYVLSTKKINDTFANQKTVSLKSLISRGKPIICKFNEIADAIIQESKY